MEHPNTSIASKRRHRSVLPSNHHGSQQQQQQAGKRRKFCPTENAMNLLAPSRGPQSFVLPRYRPASTNHRPSTTTTTTTTTTLMPPPPPRRPGLAVPSINHNNHNEDQQPFTIPKSKNLSEDDDDAPAGTLPPVPAALPKLRDSALTSENIEKTLRLIDKNASKKCDSFEHLLQAFHDLYRWSRLPHQDHRKFFLHEFVWELSGISRVMRFLRVHEMGDEFLCQLLQTELPFNE